MVDFNKNIIHELEAETKGFSALQLLHYVADKFCNDVVFSTSFGQEDQVITDIIFTENLKISVFSIDTGRLFHETLRTFNKTLEKYKKFIKIYFPEKEQIETLVSAKGPFSFYESIENRKECCHIRKVAPLKRALQGASCWVTGLRANQSTARKDLKIFEWDEQRNLVKCNPLINWSLKEIIEYIKEKNVPYNLLHDKGFVSIGCEPCTRAVKSGENVRAGRWWWEDESKKECGLHEK